jgi:hypothetical protein
MSREGGETMADRLAEQRDAKFKVWLQNKAIKDKAFEVILFNRMKTGSF